VLACHGAVSEETVRHMALGALAVSGTQLAVSISGIAGPDGGLPGKPVGTVWLGVAQQSPGQRDPMVNAQLTLFSGDREQVRRQSVAKALQLIQRRLETAIP
jgi:nicotinamide-nucleotide amidase